jgi:CheY-like chemotaxis protein
MSPYHSIRLLYVEDEVLIRTELEASLSEAGFNLEVASNGKDALAILEDGNADIQGLITDIKLSGGTNGWDVARRARELTPNLPVIYTSGARAGEWFSRGVPLSIMIEKAYTSSQVIVGLASLLNAPSLTPHLA